MCVYVGRGQKFALNHTGRSKRFEWLTAELQDIDMRLLPDPNRKPYLGSPTASLDLTLGDLKCQIQGLSIFRIRTSRDNF